MTSFILLLALAGFFAFIAFSPPAGRPAVIVSFIAFTNDAVGTRLAVFAVSNAGPWAVSRGSDYRVQLPSGRRWTDFSEGWFPTGGSTLKPGLSELVILNAPTNQSEWRIAITSRKQEGVVFGMATELLIEAQKLGLPTRYRRVSYSTFSDLVHE